MQGMSFIAMPVMPCYADPGRDADRDAGHARNLAFARVSADSWSVDDVVDELVAEARAANEAKAAYERHIGRVRELLPVARVERPDLTVVELEKLIERAYDRGTISRITAEAAGTKRPRPAAKTRRRKLREMPPS